MEPLLEQTTVFGLINEIRPGCFSLKVYECSSKNDIKSDQRAGWSLVPRKNIESTRERTGNFLSLDVPRYSRTSAVRNKESNQKIRKQEEQVQMD